MARQERELYSLQIQISTGKRVNRPSDDPVATGQILGARATKADLAQQQKIILGGHMLLRGADSALGEICSSMERTRDLLLRASTDSLSPQALEGVAVEIEGIRAGVFALGNENVGGRYIFGGRLDQGPPLEATGDTAHPVAYGGDSAECRYRVGKDATVRVTTPGDRIFNFEDATGERAVDGVDEDLFTCLAGAEQAARAGDKQALGKCLADVDAFLNHLLLARGSVGADDQRLGVLEGLAQDGEVRLTEALSALEDCDLAVAVTRLTLLQVIYEATLGVAAKAAALPSLAELGW